MIILAWALFSNLVATAHNKDKPVAGTKQVAGISSSPAKAADNSASGIITYAAPTDAATTDIPILCYHQIRDWKPSDSKTAKVYIVPVAAFRQQMQLLHDSGYHAILPDQLLAHLQHGTPLPSRPVLLTFDDGDVAQYTTALPELNKAGFKATFFVMTVSLNRPGYFSTAQVKDLYTHGHIIGCHTWDHHMVTKYSDADWVKQVEKPRAKLAEITGSPIKYFAYPFGLWNKAATQRLNKYGFTAAFRLAGKNDTDLPLFTIKRQIVDGNWSADRFMKTVKSMEKKK